MDSTRIGFIGLGNIGHPMARRLLHEGHSLTVHDVRTDHRHSLTQAGARWADDLRHLAEQVDTIITSLPGPREVTSVFESDGGLLDTMRKGQTWMEMSTNDPGVIQSIATRLASRSVETLEAPVTGGVANADAGKITIFVGGEQTVFERHRSIFDSLASKVIYLGALGNATVAKLITNMMAFVHEATLAEGLILGTRAGIDTTQLLEAIRHSYAGSFAADVDGPRVLAGTYDSAFALSLALKDMTLIDDVAAQAGVRLRFGPMATELLEQTRDAYGERADTLMAVKHLADQLGCRLSK